MPNELKTKLTTDPNPQYNASSTRSPSFFTPQQHASPMPNAKAKYQPKPRKKSADEELANSRKRLNEWKNHLSNDLKKLNAAKKQKKDYQYTLTKGDANDDVFFENLIEGQETEIQRLNRRIQKQKKRINHHQSVIDKHQPQSQFANTTTYRNNTNTTYQGNPTVCDRFMNNQIPKQQSSSKRQSPPSSSNAMANRISYRKVNMPWTPRACTILGAHDGSYRAEVRAENTNLVENGFNAEELTAIDLMDYMVEIKQPNQKIQIEGGSEKQQEVMLQRAFKRGIKATDIKVEGKTQAEIQQKFEDYSSSAQGRDAKYEKALNRHGVDINDVAKYRDPSPEQNTMRFS